MNNRINFNSGEALIASDLNLMGIAALKQSTLKAWVALGRASALIDEVEYGSGDRPLSLGSGFVGVGSYLEMAFSSGSARLLPNLYYIPTDADYNPFDDGDVLFPLLMLFQKNFVVAFNGTGSTRFDYVYINYNGDAGVGSNETRAIEDDVTDLQSTQSLAKRFEWSSGSFLYSTGAVPGGSHIKIARLSVPNGSSTAKLETSYVIPVNGVFRSHWNPASAGRSATGWNLGNHGLTSTGAANGVFAPQIPDGAHIIRARLHYSSGATFVGTFELTRRNGGVRSLTPVSVSETVEANVSRKIGVTGNLDTDQTGAFEELGGFVWKRDYDFFFSASGAGIQIHDLIIEYIY